MEKMQIKLKECCLECEHFYLDTGSIGCYGVCVSDERKIACVHMPVCYKYIEATQKTGEQFIGEFMGKHGNA